MELMSTKQIYQKSVIFVIISILKIWVLNMNHIFAMVVNGCHVATVSVKGGDYKVHFSYMSKVDAINTMNNSDLSDKRVAL